MLPFLFCFCHKNRQQQINELPPLLPRLFEVNKLSIYCPFLFCFCHKNRQQQINELPPLLPRHFEVNKLSICCPFFLVFASAWQQSIVGTFCCCWLKTFTIEKKTATTAKECSQWKYVPNQHFCSQPLTWSYRVGEEFCVKNYVPNENMFTTNTDNAKIKNNKNFYFINILGLIISNVNS